MSTEYTKFLKGKSYKAIAELISKELKPLEQLIIASNSMDYFEEKKAKGEVVPNFRNDAAQELFIKSLDDVCQILLSCNAIEKPLDTATMLKRMELPNWTQIRSFEFHLTQLKQKFSVLREVLKSMHKCGKSIVVIK